MSWGWAGFQPDQPAPGTVLDWSGEVFAVIEGKQQGQMIYQIGSRFTTSTPDTVFDPDQESIEVGVWASVVGVVQATGIILATSITLED